VPQALSGTRWPLTRGSSAPRPVLESAAARMKQAHGADLRSGLGTPFRGLAGFLLSYQEARRALRHAIRNRRSIVGPGDLRLFEELTSAGADSVLHLIPESLVRVVTDPGTRLTLESLIDADLNIAVAAKSLSLHPNSLRYRLRRRAAKSGCNPRKLADLLELIAAVRLISTAAGAERFAAARS
jgi:sugar diacid utilization regulator